MTEATPTPAGTRHRPWSAAARWLAEKDPGLLAVKRSVRAAVVMPLAFGLTHLLFSSAQTSLFSAFGAFAILLLVDFPGRPRTRLGSYLGLFLVGGCFIAVGTAVSTDKVAAVAVMAVVGFCVLFAGIISPQAATGATAALLVFVLPVAVAEPASAIGPRLVGWLAAGVLCIPACMLIWPTPWHDNLRRRLSATVAAVARLAQAHAEGRRDPEAHEAVMAELSRLREQFAGTPYPPTGAAGTAMALAKLVGRAEWVAGNAMLTPDQGVILELPPVRLAFEAVSEVLRMSASLICDGDGHPVDDADLVGSLRESTRRMDRLMSTELDVTVSTLIDPQSHPDHLLLDEGQWSTEIDIDGGLATSLDPSFRARALGTATAMVADATLEAAGAQREGDQRLGAMGEPSSLLMWSRFASHLSFHSVWFRNAVRGAAGLALAVAVVEVTDVEHGFWVVLGTLSVLRSNALGTGATALRAVGGTAVGFVLGSALMIGLGGHDALLWALLPVAVLVSGVAPSMISFAAGQAGFTLVVIILFNIIAPVGWTVGLTRIVDVAIGCGVSIVVGLLFWPRGATAALGRALSDSFVANSGYLADAVDRLTMTTEQVDTDPGQRTSHRAYLRLDDAFRQFLSERGAKVVPVETVAKLFTGSNRIRLAAFTLCTLPAFPSEPGQPELESVAVAGAVLRDSFASSHRWYEEFAEMLADRRESLDPLPSHDEMLHDVLQKGFDEARSRHSRRRIRKMLQMLWADELLDAQRQVQADLADAADRFVRRSKHRRMI
ncbi:MAG: FUSC family protein [Acidimicrobiales bacterium]